MDFVVQLLKETGVLIVNGSGFDPVYGKGHARIVFLPPIEELDAAYNALEAFMKRKAKSHKKHRLDLGLAGRNKILAINSETNPMF